MATKITLGKLAARLERLGREAPAAVLRGVHSAAYRLEGMIPEAIATASPYPPEDTRALGRSHYTVPTDDGAFVGVDAPHAPFMEWGTRPHRPPMQPLADWAYRKGLVDVELDVSDLLRTPRSEWTDEEKKAFGVIRAIVGKIASKGIEPRHFLFNALQKFLRADVLGEEIAAELDEMG